MKIVKKETKPNVKQEPTRKVDAYGRITYTIPTAHGTRLHREDGPAVEHANGHKEWWIDGKLHRDDGKPAIERADGSKEWIVNGERHRVDGPAMIAADGSQFWFQENKYHREDGPAVIYSDAHSKPIYYLKGKSYFEKDYFETITNFKKAKAISSMEKFADKFGDEKNFEKAGIALMRFLRGECNHSFKNKKEECELCDSTQ